jgi:hypothetical protein
MHFCLNLAEALNALPLDFLTTLLKFRNRPYDQAKKTVFSASRNLSFCRNCEISAFDKLKVSIERFRI